MKTLFLALACVACLDAQITQPVATTAPLFSQTNRVTVNSAGAQTLSGTGSGSLTIPAGFFSAAGIQLHFTVRGFYSTSATPGAINLVVILGGTNIGSTGNFTMPPSITNGVFTIEGSIVCITTGTSGTVATTFTVILEPSSASVTQAAGTVQGASTFTSPVTINTTTTQAFDTTAAWSAFSAGDTITSNVYILRGY